MQIKDVIANQQMLSVRDDDSVALAFQTMLWGNVRHVPVLKDGTLVGVVSERDILKHRSRMGARGSDQWVRTIMSQPPIVVTPETELDQAAQLLLEHRIGCLPVMTREKLVGIVTRSDLLRRWERQSPEPRVNGGQRVTALMKRAPLTAAADERLLDAVARMQAHSVRHLPVVDRDGRLVGMLSDRDVRGVFGHAWRSLGTGGSGRLQTTLVGDAMSQNPLSVQEDASLWEVTHLLAEHQVGALPVVATGATNVVGIVSYVDVLRASVE